MIEVTLPFAGLELVNGTQQIDETQFDFRDWKDSIIESGKIEEVVNEWSGRYLAPPIISDVFVSDRLLIPHIWQNVGEIVFLGDFFRDIKNPNYLYYRTLVYNQVSGWLQSYVCGHHTLKNFIIMYR